MQSRRSGKNTIIGISGSPVSNSNLDAAIKAILAASGMDYEFIKLSNFSIGPCVGCLNCARTNRCILKDDMPDLLQKVMKADAIVLGGFPTFKSLNAQTKLFLERFYPLKHISMLTRGKLAVTVSAGFRDAEKVEEYLTTFFSWFQMPVIGSLRLSGNPPCLSCGVQDHCDYSNIRLKYGEQAQVSPEMSWSFLGDVNSMTAAQQLGERLRDEIFFKFNPPHEAP